MFKIVATIIFFLITFNITFAKTNYGHRGGCESRKYIKMGIPENSLLCLEAGLVGFKRKKPLQYNAKFKYLEFDVRETLDNEIVVYHGGSKGRVFMNKKFFKSDHANVPYKGHRKNRKTFRKFVKDGLDISWKKVKVKDLTLKQLRKLKLKGAYNQHVPSLKEYLEYIAKLGTVKPIMVEIKDIYSEEGRVKLMSLISEFNETYATYADIIVDEDSSKGFYTIKVGFIIRKQKVKRNMGKKGSDKYHRWCDDFIGMGFKGIFKTKKKVNLCR